MGYACVTSFLFAILAIALKVALRFADSGTIVFIRFSVAFAGLFILLSLRGKKPIKNLVKPPLLAVFAGLCLAANYIGYMKGIDLTTPGNAQVLIQLAPFLLAVLGIVIFKEPIRKLQLMGIFIALAGLVLFHGTQSEQTRLSADIYKTGNLWIIASAICWAAWGVFQKLLVRTIDPQVANLIVYAIAGAATAGLVDWNIFSTFDLKIWSLMIFLGLNTLVAYVSLAEALRLIPVYQASIIVTVNPVLTLILLEILERTSLNWVSPENIGLSGYVSALIFLSGVIFVIAVKK
jgi:drug/metabolite transporter (DMT)-like permease